MYIQSITSTNFGKIGRCGGKISGRASKGTTLVAGSNKASKLDNTYKSQIKQAYNSKQDTSSLDEELNDLYLDFLDRADLRQSKFIPKKS